MDEPAMASLPPESDTDRLLSVICCFLSFSISFLSSCEEESQLYCFTQSRRAV